MKVMILAAGKGLRMGALTKDRPKPLLPVQGKALIVHQIERLKSAGFRDFVINHAYLGEQIEAHLGDGSQWNVKIHYSPEPVDAYETGGGIRRARELLGPEAFLVVSADIWTDFPYQQLPKTIDAQAHLILVPNPEHVPNGDFGLESGRITLNPPKFTYGNIGIYRPEFFDLETKTHFGLGELLRKTIPLIKITGEKYEGEWQDIGTPERYQRIASIQASNSYF